MHVINTARITQVKKEIYSEDARADLTRIQKGIHSKVKAQFKVCQRL
jgi:hypothetical protein